MQLFDVFTYYHFTKVVLIISVSVEQYLDHPVFKLDEEVLTMKTVCGIKGGMCLLIFAFEIELNLFFFYVFEYVFGSILYYCFCKSNL